MPTPTQEWMLYGANGFTGNLIAREAKKRGMQVVLAGRSESKIKTLAKELQLPFRTFSLESAEEIKKHIGKSSLVLLCAGPFSQTSEPMVQACLELGIHYLDITGEIDVLERVLSLDSVAKTQGSVLIPGVGFDVVPSDCLAKSLHEQLPEAKELTLAFKGNAVLSPGTTKTMLEILPKGSRVRRDGKLVSIPSFSLFRKIPFNQKSYFCTAIPWGDVGSAYYSTHIPNITVYAATKRWSRWLKYPALAMAPLLSKYQVQQFLRHQVEKRVTGPSAQHQKTSQMELWGEVRKGKENVQQRLRVPEGYHLTMLTALRSVEKLLAGAVAPGSYTPSMAFGSHFIDEFEGVVRS